MRQTPPDEIVITDGGSTDRTCEVIQSYIARGYPVKLIRTDQAFPGKGRNLGVQHALHEIIAFTDAGIRLHPQWLEKLCEPIEKDPAVDVVYGTYEPITDSFFKECAALAYVPAPTWRNGAAIRGPFIASSLIRKQVWEQVGGFREDLRSGEDLLFFKAVLAGGFRTCVAPEAVVHWELPGTLTGTFKRFATYSRFGMKAGLGSEWQYPVLRMYAVVAMVLLLSVWISKWLWLALPAFWIARAWKCLVRKERVLWWCVALAPRKLLVVAAILAIIDVAMVCGIISWLLKDRFHLLPSEKL